MLRDLLDRPILKRPRTCEACGTDFTCEIGLKGCWCSKVSLTDEKRSQLTRNYTDCLCPTCLQKAAGDGNVPERLNNE
jgi:hypothetical protein